MVTTVRDMFIMNSKSNGINFPILKYNVILRVARVELAFEDHGPGPRLLTPLLGKRPVGLNVPPALRRRPEYPLEEEITVLGLIDLGVILHRTFSQGRDEWHSFLALQHLYRVAPALNGVFSATQPIRGEMMSLMG